MRNGIGVLNWANGSKYIGGWFYFFYSKLSNTKRIEDKANG